jgi:hypothetical protein
VAGKGAVDANSSAGNTAEERVKRDRLVGPEELDGPIGLPLSELRAQL